MAVPLADLLYSDPYTVLTEEVTYSRYLGLHRAAGVLCHHLVFAQPTIEWQIWIDAGEQPLVRQFAISYVREPGEPQYAAVLSKWKLSPTIPDSIFRFEAPRGRRSEWTPHHSCRSVLVGLRRSDDMTLNFCSGRLPALTCLLAIVLSVLVPVGDAFAQRRGSVRSTNRSAGTSQRATTPRTQSGNTSTRTTTGQTRSGETVTGSRNVTKDGDTVTVDRDVQSSSGASASKSKEVEVDDGRVESVERSTTATDRYGRTAQYEGKAEREGAGWEFEGEGKNRYGKDVEVDGYGARGYYGTGVVADVEGGRYGNRTVVAGKPYGGPTYVRQLPYGARPHTYWGRPYYSHGGAYYRPYPGRGGVVVYGYVPPPYCIVLPSSLRWAPSS